MQQYIVKRLLLAIPTIFGAITLVFFAMHLAPGDPVSLFIPPDLPPEKSAELEQRVNEKYGFDDPLYVQYYDYVRKLSKLDLGYSLREGSSVRFDLERRLPHTLRLGLISLFVSSVIGITVGVLSAVYRGTVIDNVAMFLALLGVSMPSFWLALTLMLLFAVRIPWFPPSGLGGSATSWDGIRHLVLPVTVLALGSAGGLARYTRSSMLEVINNDYVRTARAKGLADRVVIVRHALRNALIPIVTILGLNFGFILSGAVIVETVFAWPGIGRYLIDGVNGRDFPVVQATVLLIAIGFVFGNLLTDLMLVYIDPRIRFE
ncbi:MAG TPA: ABC transporter permease [Thermomicrobiales bacterium]|jgi:ABC-type dipeptide/oligopeptide/nickel transport system permease component